MICYTLDGNTLNRGIYEYHGEISLGHEHPSPLANRLPVPIVRTHPIDRGVFYPDPNLVYAANITEGQLIEVDHRRSTPGFLVRLDTFGPNYPTNRSSVGSIIGYAGPVTELSRGYAVDRLWKKEYSVPDALLTMGSGALVAYRAGKIGTRLLLCTDKCLIVHDPDTLNADTQTVLLAMSLLEQVHAPVRSIIRKLQQQL